MLSEVNPLGCGGRNNDKTFSSIKAQAKQWYQIDLKTDGYAENILELEKICEDTGRRLVVRDWPFVNFVPFEDNNMSPPGRLLALEALKGKCGLRAFAFFRDGIDVWISRGCKPPKEFFGQYMEYLKAVLAEGMPVFKYEDFCVTPERVMREICAYAGLEYSEQFRDYHKFTKFNGDSSRLEEIKLPKRRGIKLKKRLGLAMCKGMREAQELIGYPATYDNGNLGIKTGLLRRLKNIFD